MTASKFSRRAFLALSTAAAAAGMAVHAEANGLPSLDSLAGDWLAANRILNPPAVDNRRDMAEIRYDLISTRFNPGGGMLPQTVTAVPLPVFRLNGIAHAAREMRWKAYEVSRRNRDCDGVEVVTDAGERFPARTAIVATPLNCWHDIDFEPALHPAKQAVGSEGHAGHFAKVWLLAEGLPEPDFFAAGAPDGAGRLNYQRNRDFSALLPSEC